MPYSTAATCLHMPAQSGQLHESSISSGEGNRPWFCRQIRSMTPLDNRPCSNSTDRKSTRLNSSHLVISYAVFCLKKKNQADGEFLGAAVHLAPLGVRPDPGAGDHWRPAHIRARGRISSAPSGVSSAFFFLMIGRPPISTLFPYTSPFR